MSDKITKRLEARNAALKANDEAMERWFKKLLRAARAVEGLRAERRRLLKPRPLEPHEKGSGKLAHDDWHKIMGMVEPLDDPIPDFLRRN